MGMKIFQFSIVEFNSGLDRTIGSLSPNQQLKKKKKVQLRGSRKGFWECNDDDTQRKKRREIRVFLFDDLVKTLYGPNYI